MAANKIDLPLPEANGKSMQSELLITRTIAAIACCGALLVTNAANAHYLWIEQAQEAARLYYGEADLRLTEKSPGKLDNIKSPQAFIQRAANDKPAAVAISRNAEHFAIDGAKRAPAVLVAEESLEVRDLTKHGLGVAKSNYYARHGQPGTNGTASPLALDVQGRGPNTLALLYRGQPLKGAKVEVIAPNTWMQEHKTDAQGVVQINTPWRGQYILHVLHVDQAPGDFAGQKYENLRNHLTYSFIRNEGANPGLAVPPKHVED
jgi:hypothetical protein